MREHKGACIRLIRHDMSAVKHKAVFDWAVAMTIAVVLVVASPVVAQAHSGGHAHHGDHAAAQSQSSHVVTVLSATPAEFDVVMKTMCHGSDHGTPGASHNSCNAGCCDFCCHGGVAILATDLSAAVWPEAADYGAASGIGRGATVFAFERPPKALALA